MDSDPYMEDESLSNSATKLDKAVAKYMYYNVPRRVGSLEHMDVECFFGDDAVNALLDSPWATGRDCIFTDRQSCVDFCHMLIVKELFHKAKIARRKPKPGKPSGGTVTDGNETPNEEGKKSKKTKSKTDDESKPDASSDADANKPKKVKKLKLEMSHDQYFEDGREVFVWIYEPVQWKNTIIGLLILVGLIAMCCYPLWPPIVRTGLYYVSIAGAVFLGVILFLAVFRYVVYGLIMALTFGKHKFFLFPNLTEDCGFFESFVPLYEYSCAGEEKCKKSKKKSKEDDKNSDDKDSSEAATGSSGGGDATTEQEITQPTKNDSSGSSESGGDFEVIQKEELSD